MQGKQGLVTLLLEIRVAATSIGTSPVSSTGEKNDQYKQNPGYEHVTPISKNASSKQLKLANQAHICSSEQESILFYSLGD